MLIKFRAEMFYYAIDVILTNLTIRTMNGVFGKFLFCVIV